MFFIFFSGKSYSEEQNVFEVLEIIQKDLKTLEKAVYSSSNSDNLNSTIEFDQNADDVSLRNSADFEFFSDGNKTQGIILNPLGVRCSEILFTCEMSKYNYIEKISFLKCRKDRKLS